jgi:CMP-N-acetylneuraminic acid synthetase
MEKKDAPMPTPGILALIPARAGSKGLPGKNLRPLGGRPLIAYSILAAKACPLVERVVVTTDDEDIAGTAKRFGAEAPFLRPAALAQDTSELGDALNFTLTELAAREGYRPEHVALFYPTSPFRAKELVDGLLGKLFQGYTTLKTVKHMPARDALFYRPDTHSRVNRLQSGLGRPAAGGYLRSYGLLSAWQTSPTPEERAYLHRIDHPAELIDIDSLADFRLAEAVLEQGLYDKETAW